MRSVSKPKDFLRACNALYRRGHSERRNVKGTAGYVSLQMQWYELTNLSDLLQLEVQGDDESTTSPLRITYRFGLRRLQRILLLLLDHGC